MVDLALKHLKSYQVGVKVTPVSTAKDSYDANPIETYTYLIQELSKRNIGFVELVESSDAPSKNVYPQTQKEQIPSVLAAFRPHFKGIIIGNNGFNQYTGLAAIQSGLADIVSFGRLYVSNPDLAERIINKQELNGAIDWANIGGYQSGAKGYTDYPFYGQ